MSEACTVIREHSVPAMSTQFVMSGHSLSVKSEQSVSLQCACSKRTHFVIGGHIMPVMSEDYLHYS